MTSVHKAASWYRPDTAPDTRLRITAQSLWRAGGRVLQQPPGPTAVPWVWYPVAQGCLATPAAPQLWPVLHWGGPRDETISRRQELQRQAWPPPQASLPPAKFAAALLDISQATHAHGSHGAAQRHHRCGRWCSHRVEHGVERAPVLARRSADSMPQGVHSGDTHQGDPECSWRKFSRPRRALHAGACPASAPRAWVVVQSDGQPLVLVCAACHGSRSCDQVHLPPQVHYVPLSRAPSPVAFLRRATTMAACFAGSRLPREGLLLLCWRESPRTSRADSTGRARPWQGGKKIALRGGDGTEAYLPNPPPPPPWSPCREGGLGWHCPTCRAGGGGPTPTYMTQNDPHVALIILTTHMWGNIFS